MTCMPRLREHASSVSISEASYLKAALLFAEEQLDTESLSTCEFYVPSEWFYVLLRVSQNSAWSGNRGTHGVWASWNPLNKRCLIVTDVDGKHLVKVPLPEPQDTKKIPSEANAETCVRLFPVLLSDGLSVGESLEVCSSLFC